MNGNHFLKNKNILVTGAGGFVGKNLVKRLLSLDANILATFHNNMPKLQNEHVEYIHCDLLDGANCFKIMEDINYVFHSAGITSSAGRNNRREPNDLFKANFVMNMNVIEASFRAKVKKLLFISSTTAYPDLKDSYLNECDFFIGDPYEKYFNLGWMYRMSEVVCRMYAQSTANKTVPVVLRPSNIYGIGDNFETAKSHVIPSLIRKTVENKERLVVWGDGKDIRDFIYINDFIDAALLAMEKIEKYLPLNIGLGKGYDIASVLKFILKIQGINNIRIKYDLGKPSMIPIRLLNISKAKKEIGFKPSIDIEEGLKLTIDWYKNNSGEI